MKSIGAPLALLRLAEVYGPWVLTLKVGDYVAGLDPKWKRIRFLDAANMSTGFGGTGTFKTNPNDILDGYLDGKYDEWYTARSHLDKLAQINANLHPYPWEPGTVVRYRDQDFYLLGAAIDAFLKSMRGPSADIWKMLIEEVFQPIGILHAPAVRTREAPDRDGLAWFNAGFYPSLDDLAKIALLYQQRGAHEGHQLLHRELTTDLLAARNAIRKDGDSSLSRTAPENAPDGTEFYLMGFHFVPYVGSKSHRRHELPTMSGFGENEVTIYPNQVISIVMGNAAKFSPGDQIKSEQGPQTIRAVDRLSPF
jgi:CubicO group peptidase (beta-lactamase class C family)